MRIEDVGLEKRGWEQNQLLFTDDTVMVADSEERMIKLELEFEIIFQAFIERLLVLFIVFNYGSNKILFNCCF